MGKFIDDLLRGIKELGFVSEETKEYSFVRYGGKNEYTVRLALSPAATEGTEKLNTERYDLNVDFYRPSDFMRDGNKVIGVSVQNKGKLDLQTWIFGWTMARVDRYRGEDFGIKTA